MTNDIKKSRHPFTLFCLNLLHIGTLPERVQAERQITLGDLATLPREAQWLLAYSLEKDNAELTLLNHDTDARELLSAGWLITIPCETIGVTSFRVKPDIWRKLRSVRSSFFTQDLLSHLEAYKKRKSALYPWVW